MNYYRKIKEDGLMVRHLAQQFLVLIHYFRMEKRIRSVSERKNIMGYVIRV